jgi:hypothetical protein
MTIGRPNIITKVTLQKLEEVFALGGSDKEACFYADISPSTLYNYQIENPDFLERKELLKENPILLARRTVVSELTKNSYIAFKYLERKRRDEFGFGGGNGTLPIPIITGIRSDDVCKEKADKAISAYLEGNSRLVERL